MPPAGGDGYSVDEDVFGAMAKRIQLLVPLMQRELRQLDGEMQALFATWRGRSSQSFHKLHTNWGADSQKLKDALNGIAGQLQDSLKGYVSADEGSVVKS